MARRTTFSRDELLRALDVRYKQLQAEEHEADPEELACIVGAKGEIQNLEQAIRLGVLPGEEN